MNFVARIDKQKWKNNSSFGLENDLDYCVSFADK